MAAKPVGKDKYICQEGQPLDAIHIIVQGSVNAHFQGGDIVLKKGDVVGLCDIAFDSHFFTYQTLEDSSFVSFPIKDSNSIASIVKVNPEVGKMLYTSMINQVIMIFSIYAEAKKGCKELYAKVQEFYNDYLDICSHNNIISRSLPGFEELEELELEDDLADWMLPYYVSIRDFPQDLKLNLSARIPFLNGFVIRSSEDIHSAFSVCSEMQDYRMTQSEIFMRESHMDIFDLYASLLMRLKQGTPDAEKVTSSLEAILTLLKKDGFVDSGLIEAREREYRDKQAGFSNAPAAAQTQQITNADLANATDIILEYASVTDEEANNFKTLLNKYKKLTDKGSTDDPVRKLRLELTKAFYQIYQSAFQMSVRDYNLPPIMKMFFNFGFVDAELAGAENTNFLFNIVNDFRGDEDMGVYTAHEWLMAIYKLKKEPSRNEFDTDYLQYLHEQKVAGKLTAQQEDALAKDPGERVLFELTNMFPLCNKVTFGRLSTFCPILSESDVIKPLQSCLVTVDTLRESIKQLEDIDYGAFYRETIYSDEKIGITKEIVNVRVLPDIILMPNIGTRGVMWQEIEGKKRTTPSRYMVSVFHMEDLPTTITRLTGEYRWEMCKRIQGARWNDVSDRSLTSEYFDYIQFYKKNSELSSDAKEKIKNSLTKAKNSFKEMFVRDYITWVLFEGQGSPRLNKLARAILCTYCPFPKELRVRISANPMFKEFIERYDIKTNQKLHHFDNVITKIKAANKPVPPEFEAERKFIEGTI